jgi:hypothetical protein
MVMTVSSGESRGDRKLSVGFSLGGTESNDAPYRAIFGGMMSRFKVGSLSGLGKRGDLK